MAAKNGMNELSFRDVPLFITQQVDNLGAKTFFYENSAAHIWLLKIVTLVISQATSQWLHSIHNFSETVYEKGICVKGVVHKNGVLTRRGLD